MKKHALKSKEIWASIIVVVNGLLNATGYPSIDVTPELMVSVGIVFFALRNWFTESAVIWKNGAGN